MFSRRGYNIDSLTVGVTADPRYSRMTVVCSGDDDVLEQITKQLNKLVEVVKVRTLDESSMIGRELMILKVSAGAKTRNDIMTVCSLTGARVADLSPTSITAELSDTPERIQIFEDMMRPFGILEVARTGVIALQRGPGKI